MASDIHLLRALSASARTVLLDKGHYGQYNTRSLDMVSSIVSMWCKVLDQVGGPAGLIYCTTGISPGDLEKLPLTSGYAYTGETRLDLMVQRALERILATWQQRLGRLPRLGVIRDGAHAIPQLLQASRAV